MNATDVDAFLADIREHADDDAPRLRFADWCDEEGFYDRAEFIRVQCALARLGPSCNDLKDTLRHQESCLWVRLRPVYTYWFSREVHIALMVDDVGAKASTLVGVVRRGFVERIYVPYLTDTLISRLRAWRQSSVVVLDSLVGSEVVIGDREPYFNGAGFAWYNADRSNPTHNVPAAATLSRMVYDALPYPSYSSGNPGRWKAFPTALIAHAELAKALLTLAR